MKCFYQVRSCLFRFPVHIYVPCQTSDDYDVCEYDENGLVLFTNTYSASFDLKNSDESREFNLSTLIDAFRKLKKSDALLPFSAGVCLCFVDCLRTATR